MAKDEKPRQVTVTQCEGFPDDLPCWFPAIYRVSQADHPGIVKLYCLTCMLTALQYYTINNPGVDKLIRYIGPAPWAMPMHGSGIDVPAQTHALGWPVKPW